MLGGRCTTFATLILLERIVECFSPPPPPQPPSYGYRELAHHELGEEIRFGSDGRLQKVLSDLDNYYLFISAWVKPGSGFHILGSTSSTGSYIHEKTLSSQCVTIEQGAWIFLTQIYSHESTGGLTSQGYFRSTTYAFPCNTGCGTCTNNHLSNVFGSEIKQSVANQGTGSVEFLYLLKVQETAITEKIERISSGLILRDSDKIDLKIANVLTSGKLVEIINHQVYFRNFHYASQNHLFSSDPSFIPNPGSSLKYSEKDFYKKFSSLGFKLDRNTEIKVREGTKLFDESNGYLPKSFCFSSSYGAFAADFLAQHQKFHQEVKIYINPNLKFIIKFMLFRLTPTRLQPRIWVRMDENNGPPYDEYQVVRIYQDHTLEVSNLMRMSFCFSFVLVKAKNAESIFYLYVTARSKRTKPKDGIVNSELDLKNKGVEFEKKYTVTENMAGAEADIFYSWSCTASTECENRPFYLMHYREFLGGGHSDIYSVDVQSQMLPDADKTNEKCNHFIGEGSSKICINCNRGTTWDPVKKICRGSTHFIPLEKGRCSDVQEINLSLCQMCSESPKWRGIASPECPPQAPCQPPSYNHFEKDRCDYCLNETPENCRCNDFQNSVVNTAKPKANYCVCQVPNCKLYN